MFKRNYYQWIINWPVSRNDLVNNWLYVLVTLVKSMLDILIETFKLIMLCSTGILLALVPTIILLTATFVVF